MGKIFNILYTIFSKHRWIFGISVALLFIAGAYFALRIRVVEDVTQFIPEDKKIEKLNYVFQHLKSTDKLIVSVYDNDSVHSSPEKLIAYADSLTTFLEKNYSGYIRGIRYKVSDSEMYSIYDLFYSNFPVFLEESDYLRLDSLTESKQIREHLHKDLQALMMPGSFTMKKFILGDPAGFMPLVLNKLKRLKVDDNYITYNGCIFSSDMKNLMLFIVPFYPVNETSNNARLLKAIDRQTNKLSEGSSVRARYFGAVAVAVGNANQLKKDSILTLSLAGLVIVVFISIFFRKRFAWLVIFLPVVFGGVFAMAILGFIKPDLSALALAAGSVVFGIALNYSMHIYSHFQHTRSVRTVISDLSTPLTIGSFTTIAAFLCLLLTKSEALRDFGVFSALTLIGTILFSLIVMPHLLPLQKTHPIPSKTARWVEKIAGYQLPKHKLFVLFLLIASIVLLIFSQKTGFESDMAKMNYMSHKLLDAEKKINAINNSTSGSLYLVSTGKTLNEALLNNELVYNGLNNLKQKGAISRFTHVGSFLTDDSIQKQRISRWNAYWTPEKKRKFTQNLKILAHETGFSSTAFSESLQLINKTYTVLGSNDINRINGTLLNEWVTKTPTMSMVLTQVVVNPNHKKEVKEAFINHEDVTVLDKSVYSNLFITLISDDFNMILWVSSLLVFATLLFSYGRIELAFITFIPMLLSWVWITGFMGIFGLGFNIINIIICTFIFGLGDDYSIFVMDGLQQEYKYGKKLLSSYKTAIFLSAFTTITGVGVLIFAKHPALQSIALVSIIGMISVVFISYTIEPLMFKFLVNAGKHRRSEPSAWFLIFYAPIFYGFYVASCFATIIFWFLILQWLPIGEKRKKHIFHFMMMYLSRATIFVMFLVRKRIINFDKEIFAKPSVIIFNHQSIIDIPLTMMFSPKVIILTTDWVWKHPLVGKIARAADFYPVSQGIDNLIDHLRKKVHEGYSLLMFPEGHRSPDLHIKRFHKGAFYIAEQLGLDIVPAVMHGTGEYVSKGEFLGKVSTITVKFLDRITPDDPHFGTSLAEKAKNIGLYFKDEHEKLLDTFYRLPVYQKKRVIKNYIYKGPVLEWYVRVKLKLENNYSLYHQLLPREGVIIDAGCGYGYISIMLALLSPKRTITGVDFDEEKIEVARHCLTGKNKVTFKCADVSDYSFPRANGIILSDVVHYLNEGEQEKLFNNCIASLQPGGVLLIREADSKMQKHHKVTLFTEFFSNLSGFNHSKHHQLYFTSAAKIQQLAKKNAMDFKIYEKSKFTSNLLIVLTKPENS